MNCILNGFPCWLQGKESTCHVGDTGSISGLGRSPGEGNGSSCQYSYLENPMGRAAWWAIARGVIKSQTRPSNTATRSQNKLTEY